MIIGISGFEVVKSPQQMFWLTCESCFQPFENKGHQDRTQFEVESKIGRVKRMRSFQYSCTNSFPGKPLRHTEGTSKSGRADNNRLRRFG